MLQEIFKVKVKKVTTTKIRSKLRRERGVYGYTAEGKKAVVSLTEDSKTIEFFDGLM
jgi:large subunit ribosomal protein L23